MKKKDYKVYKCPHCSCEYYDKTAKKGRKVGNPILECPECGKKSYRSSISEPALISAEKFFGIRFSSRYGNMRIALILIYAAFLFVILVKKELVLGVGLVGLSVALYAMYELIRISHRRKYLKSESYNKEIELSMKRLSNISYAARVIKDQGIDAESVYYYELKNKSEEADEK